MAHDYKLLDAAILGVVAEKLETFQGLAYRVKSYSYSITDNDPDHAWRVVDRRLQVLRKAGKIRYQRKPEGWVLVTREQLAPI